jgi:glycosyltransferase involved in cell wall biosynthesis
MAGDFIFLNSVTDEMPRPLWSVMIPVYNCAKLLEYTLESVLAQALEPSQMEIVVVDDCSTDNPGEVVNRLGKNRVKYFRQPKNLGHTGNFETCLTLSKGEYVHLLHGDDRVLPGFYNSFTDLFKKEPSLGAAFCRVNFIDEHNLVKGTSKQMCETGVFTDFYSRITREQIIQTPSIVVKRSVYETIGMFNRSLSWCEDWEMWARIGKTYPVGFINDILAEYRMHSSSNSGKYFLLGENVKDLKRGMKLIHAGIEDAGNRKISKQAAGEIYARNALSQAVLFLKNNQKQGARNQLKEAFLMSPRLDTNLVIVKYFLKSL